MEIKEGKRKTISAVEARVHLGDIMKRSFKNHERFIVEKSGIPMVVIINAQEFEGLLRDREDRFKILDQIKAKLPDIPSAEVEEDVRRAVQAVRRRSRV